MRGRGGGGGGLRSWTTTRTNESTKRESDEREAVNDFLHDVEKTNDLQHSLSPVTAQRSLPASATRSPRPSPRLSSRRTRLNTPSPSARRPRSSATPSTSRALELPGTLSPGPSAPPRRFSRSSPAGRSPASPPRGIRGRGLDERGHEPGRVRRERAVLHGRAHSNRPFVTFARAARLYRARQFHHAPRRRLQRDDRAVRVHDRDPRRLRGLVVLRRRGRDQRRPVRVDVVLGSHPSRVLAQEDDARGDASGAVRRLRSGRNEDGAGE
eukprot:30937-Pelagococcus_subviridis.AAC.45